MATNKVFVSPGVFTSERDLTFVQRQVGVTTLGLVGETLKGPAFEPIFVTDYDEFRTFFGGQDPTKERATQQPLYELPYIAKSYLTQSNQLFVTRVLGFSGYDAGYAWGITLDAALNPNTSAQTASYTYTGVTDSLIEYTADTTNNTISNIDIYDSLLDYFYNEGIIDDNINTFLVNGQTGDTASFGPFFDKPDETQPTFTGVSSNMEIIETNDVNSGTTTGVTSGVTIYYSGTAYEDAEDRIVALLRSRGFYDGDEILNFQVTGSNVDIDNGSTNVQTNPLAPFRLTGTSLNGQFGYTVSFNRNSKNYISRVLGKRPRQTKAEVFVEELYQTMMDNLISDNKVRGINLNLVDYGREFYDYKQQYQAAITPFVVSEVRGDNLLRLFRLWTISDGNAANHEIKVSIENILPDKREFNVVIRDFNDTDENPRILEQFSRCTMNRNSNKYVGRRIGTMDGEFESNSNYVLVEPETGVDFDDAFPAGFAGYPIRDYQANGNGTVQAPKLEYKKNYNAFEKKRKFYLGVTDTVGIDQDLFDYKGVPDDPIITKYTGMTKGYHLDKEASATTIEDVQEPIDATGGTYQPIFEFETSFNEFKSEFQLFGTQFEDLVARKFTFVPYGGFDGWDIYRKERTNSDAYAINGFLGTLGEQSGAFDTIALSTGADGITSDYYAYFEGIRTFHNPEQVNINVFATPGIDTFDNTDLVEESIEMIEEERSDSLYIMTTPDVDRAGTPFTAADIAAFMDGRYDSNYTATYWPWVQVRDTENNQRIYLPPTRDVVRNIALTDNVRFPWFAPAGVQRGNVDALNVRKNLTLEERDTLYEARINPIARFASEGILVFGQKTMQIEETALDRINVRRLLLQARKLISSVALRLLFEQNDDVVRNQFLSLVNPILENIRSERGLQDFRVELSNDPEEIDRNELNGTIYIKPTRALEYINIEFAITPTGANFEDI